MYGWKGVEVYFLKKLILHRSDIRERNENQNIKEYSKAKLQTASTYFAQTLFLQPNSIPAQIQLFLSPHSSLN